MNAEKQKVRQKTQKILIKLKKQILQTTTTQTRMQSVGSRRRTKTKNKSKQANSVPLNDSPHLSNNFVILMNRPTEYELVISSFDLSSESTLSLGFE